MDMKFFHFCFWSILLGYLLGYYFRGIGNMSVGKLFPSS